MLNIKNGLYNMSKRLLYEFSKFRGFTQLRVQQNLIKLFKVQKTIYKKVWDGIITNNIKINIKIYKIKIT